MIDPTSPDGTHPLPAASAADAPSMYAAAAIGRCIGAHGETSTARMQKRSDIIATSRAIEIGLDPAAYALDVMIAAPYARSATMQAGLRAVYEMGRRDGETSTAKPQHVTITTDNGPRS